jgi:uncharacterized membrane protein YciS (DUF1049 family)
MPEQQMQSAASHTRWFPLYHFVALPAVLIGAIYGIYLGITAPSLNSAVTIVFTVGVVCAVLATRVMVVTVQDRLIRLEETVRLRRVLPEARHSDIDKLSRAHFIALRFASDSELAGLVGKVAANELSSKKEIKGAIKNWRADWFRA